jgi:hypothetical protein
MRRIFCVRTQLPLTSKNGTFSAKNLIKFACRMMHAGTTPECQPVSTAELFQHRSIDLSLGGRYTLASRYDTRGSRREFACRTSRVSPYQMHISVPVLGPVGERILTYFGDFGSLDGWISDLAEGGLLLDLELPREKREKFITQLAWLKKRQDEAVADVRAQKRIVPKNPHSTLIFGDGTTVNCLVIDISPSGVAVSADVDPEIGTRLAVGRCVGYVVRRFAEGFAVQFDQLQSFENLERVMSPPRDYGKYVQKSGLLATGAMITHAPRPEKWMLD